MAFGLPWLAWSYDIVAYTDRHDLIALSYVIGWMAIGLACRL